MAKKPTDKNAHTEGRVVEYREALLDYLKEQGLATKDEIDDFIFNKFRQQFTPEDLGPVVNEKGKVLHAEKWRNDVDWVKAGLTRSDLTVTFGELVLLLPTVVGHINSSGHIITRSDTVRLLGKIVRKLL